MRMIPHFDRQEAFPHHDDERSEHSSANDPIYEHEGESVPIQEKISKLPAHDLFVMRQAHEMNLKLGYRDPKIDTGIIDAIKRQMTTVGIDESEYKKFLSQKK